MLSEAMGDSETTRSGLFYEAVRIIREMREDDIRRGTPIEFVRPRWAIYENVPGALSSNNGRDFQAVLTELIKIAEPNAPDVPLPKKWSKSGCLYDEMGRWSVAWRIHSAEFWGVPQRRYRIAVVADFGGLSASEVLFERKGSIWNSEESREAWKEPSRDPQTSLGSTGRVADNSLSLSAATLKIRGGREIDSHGNKAGKGALIQWDKSATLGTSQDQTLFVWRGMEQDHRIEVTDGQRRE